MPETLAVPSHAPENGRRRQMLADIKEQGVEVVFADRVPTRDIVFGPDTPLKLKRNIQNAVEAARNYASGNLMTDSWGNDKEKRTKFQTQMTRKYGEMFRKLENANRLRGNVIMSIYSRVEVLAHLYEHMKVPVPQGLTEIAKNMPAFSSEEYATKTLQEKLKLVDQYTSVARKLLLIFTKPPQ